VERMERCKKLRERKGAKIMLCKGGEWIKVKQESDKNAEERSASRKSRSAKKESWEVQ